MLLTTVVILFAVADVPWAIGSPEAAGAPQSPASSDPRSEKRRRSDAASAKVQRYVDRVIATHDANGDGQLQKAEWAEMKGQPEQVDANHDGLITRGEFSIFVTRFSARRQIRLVVPEETPAAEPPLLQPKSADAPRSSPPTRNEPVAIAAKPGPAEASVSTAPPSTPSPAPVTEPQREPPKPASRKRDTKFFVPADRLPTGLPSWFHSRDLDGDGQVTLGEYSDSMTSSTLAEFRRFDRDGDGVVTADECLGRKPTIPRPKIPEPPRKASTTQEEPEKASSDDSPQKEGRRRRREESK